MSEAAPPTTPGPRAEILYCFCRLQLPAVNLAPDRCQHHLQRTFGLYQRKVETPLTWTGKLMKKSEVYNKFVFSLKSQIVHVNGLTYDFLFGMAKELEEKESLMLMGGAALA